MAEPVDETQALATIRNHPENAATYLTYAALLVDEYCRTHDGTYGQETINQAILAQIQFWDVNNINPETITVEGSSLVASASLNGGSYTLAGSEQAAAARVAAGSELCWRAQAILRAATGGSSRRRIMVVG